MLHKKAVKKIEKALGVKVQEGYNGKHYVEYEGKICSWYASQKWGEKDGILEASGWHVRSADDISDPHTDYFAGSFRDNVTQMISAVKPKEAKFSVGCLVRGKPNKRATRQGYAGKVGLVTGSGTYVKVEWLGEEPPTYSMTYPERDLELVSS
jgi:hypothetical protein